VRTSATATPRERWFGCCVRRQFGIDLLALTRTLLLDGEHILAEPKKLRYRLPHVAARLVRTARRTILRIAHQWPWANELAAAYTRRAALPRPRG
jgi:hypothetical protein